MRPGGRYYVQQPIRTESGRTNTSYTYDTLEEARDYIRRRDNERNPLKYIRTKAHGRYSVHVPSKGLAYKTFNTVEQAIAYRDGKIPPKSTVDVTAQEKINPLWGVWK